MKFAECHTEYINLKYRSERNERMIGVLVKAKIQATRFEAIHWKDVKWDEDLWRKMLSRTPGACGCYMSQVQVMKNALEKGKDAWVMEDDLIYCDDIQERFTYIENFLNKNEWDIFWLGATFHCNPPHWHNGRNRLNQRSNLGRDAERTSDSRIIRTYGIFCTYSYVVNFNSIPKVLELLDSVLINSVGIDHSMIVIQPQLKTYCFVPGSCFQVDGFTDIGVQGGSERPITKFSGFLKMNGTEVNSEYVFKNNMYDFNPDAFRWEEVV